MSKEVCPTCGAVMPGEVNKKLKPHGTVAAARRHQRKGEPLCEPCRKAIQHHNHMQYNKKG